MDHPWYEVWADETLDVPYLLLVLPTAEGFEILDPKEGGCRVFASPDYVDVVDWLCADEYRRVGRVEPVD